MDTFLECGAQGGFRGWEAVGEDLEDISWLGWPRSSDVPQLWAVLRVNAFTKEPILELRRAPVRAQLRGVLDEFDAEPIVQVPVWVGEDARTGGALVSTDPGEPERVVAESGARVRGRRRPALELAARSSWRRRSATQRAQVLIRAAAWLRERRLMIAALEVRETAKPWREADGDVCEAIDFLEYYAREAVELQDRPAELIQPPGSATSCASRARGVVP